MAKEKEAILQHLQDTMIWADKLTLLTEEEWRTPIADGKWTVAEVMGHFRAWDEFVVRKRLSHFFEKGLMPEAPDTEELNEQSAKYSREHSREQVIGDFIAVRKELFVLLNDVEGELWTREFTAGQREHTLYSYFLSVKEHDLHHLHQIAEKLDLQKLQ